MRTDKGNGSNMEEIGSEQFMIDINHKEELLRNIFVPLEAKIMYLQGLLVWETPIHSFILFATVNFIFW